MSTDTLSEVLRAVRLTGAVFFAVDASAPWVADTPASSELRPHLMPGVEHVIDYHVVTSGSCWGGLIGEPAFRLETGDVIAFPQGDAHVLSSAPGMRGTPPSREALLRVPNSRLPVLIEKDGGGVERARLICGFLGCDARPFNPLLATLPRVIHVPRSPTDDGVLDHLIQLALAESNAKRAGGEAVLARLSELMFVEVVRRHVASLPAENVGWLAGLRDESIGRALGKLHDRPAHGWSLEELAREVGMSRSVLAERFSHFVGVPPIQYLAQWRMQLASSLLSSTSMGLAEIAEKVGYGSETALSRAYKRWVGVAPAEWRRSKQSGAVTES
jgi:AraC-like DNA-binding protein